MHEYGSYQCKEYGIRIIKGHDALIIKGCGVVIPMQGIRYGSINTENMVLLSYKGHGSSHTENIMAIMQRILKLSHKEYGRYHTGDLVYIIKATWLLS